MYTVLMKNRYILQPLFMHQYYDNAALEQMWVQGTCIYFRDYLLMESVWFLYQERGPPGHHYTLQLTKLDVADKKNWLQSQVIKVPRAPDFCGISQVQVPRPLRSRENEA